MQREQDMLATLDPDGPWLVVSLVPDLPGQAPIDRAVFRAVQSRMSSERPGMPWSGLSYARFPTGYRRLRADGGTGRDGSATTLSRWCGIELHADGSGAYAVRLGDLNEHRALPQEPERTVLIGDEGVAGGLLAGVERLAEHAWESGSGGMANVDAYLWPVTDDRPTALGHSRGFIGDE